MVQLPALEPRSSAPALGPVPGALAVYLASALYGTGGLLVLWWLAAGPPPRSTAGLVAVAAGALLVAAVAALRADRAGRWEPDILAAAGTIAVTLAIAAAGTGGTALAAVYVWVAIYAGIYVPGARLLAQLALLGAACIGVVLAHQPSEGLIAPSGGVVLAVVAVGAALVTRAAAGRSGLVPRRLSSPRPSALSNAGTSDEPGTLSSGPAILQDTLGRLAELLDAGCVALVPTGAGGRIVAHAGMQAAGREVDVDVTDIAARIGTSGVLLERRPSDVLAALAALTGRRGTLLVMRLVSGDGPLIVALGFNARVPRETDVDVAVGMTALLQTAIAERDVVAAHERASLVDPLTGLASRARLMDRLSHALSRHRPDRVSLILMDVDHFARINETFGHDAGDQMLSEIALRLRDIVPADQTLARLGGDEFAILLEGVDEEEVVALAGSVIGGIGRPMLVGDHEVFPSASAGISFGGPDDTAPRVLRDADAALNRAKDGGRHRYEVYDERARQRVVHRMRTEGELRRALQRGELEVHYQPIVRMADRRVAAAEALLRWRHPERGLVAPAELIPLAEETGLIVPIGGWVLERACRDAAAWGTAESGPLPVTVNLSGLQLGDPRLIGHVVQALRGADYPADRLTLEITETMLFDNARALAALDQLRALGVSLALDDFGTGYSSLSELKTLPIDMVKLDRSLVAGLPTDQTDDAIAAAVVAMARALAIPVVAEGVEREDQAARLTELGFDLGQGHLYARPCRAGEFRAVGDTRDVYT